MFIYLIFSIFLLFFIKNLTVNLDIGKRLIVLFVIFIFLLCFIIFLIMIKPIVFKKLSQKIVSIFKNLDENKKTKIENIIETNYLRFVEGMKNVRELKFKIFPILILTIFSFISLNSLSYFFMKSLYLNPSYYTSFLLQFIYHFFVGWSVTPGGSGISEAIYSSLFLTQVDLSKILPLTILFKFFTYYIYILIGGILTFRELSSFLEIYKIYEEKGNY